MKLYGFPPSPNTWKVRAIAAHLGLALDLEFVDITKGQSHSPGYLALNPTDRTPVLVDGDFTLWESNAIMQYLASCTRTRFGLTTHVPAPTSCGGKAGSWRTGAKTAASR